jgi:futalosine hydrolase
MTLALTTATAAEMRAALDGLATVPTVPEGEDGPNGATFPEGAIRGELACAAVCDQALKVPERGAVRACLAGREAILVVTGVGPLNASLEMGAALGRYEISGVINLGLAGSFDLERAPLGSAVAASAEVYPEYGVAGLDGMGGLVDDTEFPFPQWEDGGQRVMRRIELGPAAEAWRLGLSLPAGQLLGTALTVAGITGCRDRALVLAEHFGALTENMEGFALALACATRGLPFLEVRTISNRVGERDRAKWKLKQAFRGLGTVLARLFSSPGPL